MCEKTKQLIQVPRGAYDLWPEFAYEYSRLLRERICCVKLLSCVTGSLRQLVTDLAQWGKKNSHECAFMHTFDTGHLPCACRQIDLFAQFAKQFSSNHADLMLISSKGCTTKYLEFTSPENFINKPFWTSTDLNILPKAVKLHYWYNIWPAVD